MKHPGFSVIVGSLAFLLLCGCDRDQVSKIDTLIVDEGPIKIEYGPQQQFNGVWLAEFEGSIFNYCSVEMPGCPEMMFDNWGCWLEFSEPAQSQLRTALSIDLEWYEVEGVYVMTFLGRETLRRGMYGHLGGSSCQILIEDLQSIQVIEPEREDSRMERLQIEQDEGATNH